MINFVFKHKDEKAFGALIIVSADNSEFAWYILSTIVKSTDEFVQLHPYLD